MAYALLIGAMYDADSHIMGAFPIFLQEILLHPDLAQRTFPAVSYSAVARHR